MFMTASQQAIRLINPSKLLFELIRNPHQQPIRCKLFCRSYGTDAKRSYTEKVESETETKELLAMKPKEVFEKEFPGHFSEGKFINRISYVDFVDQALEKLKDLGLEKDKEAYKELLRVFPPGKYRPEQKYAFGHYHMPQQLCAIRVLCQMELNGVRVDKDFERIVIDAFGISSQVWLKVARMNFWSMKGRNIDQYPLPEELPTKPHEMAKVSLMRMTNDLETIIRVANTSSLPNVIDKTWVVYSQSPTQQLIIEKLDKKSILYMEESGLLYVGDRYLSYFTLKVYDSEDEIERRRKKAEQKPDFNYNTLQMKFYGKPVMEKLEEFKDLHHTGDGYVLAIGLTGTSSHDSILSWLKLLQQRNPNLNNLNVLFKLKRPTTDVIETQSEQPYT